MLGKGLRYCTSLRGEIAGRNKTGGYTPEVQEGMAIRVVKHPGFLSRVLACVRSGITRDPFAHPLLTTETWGLTTPSGWLGWARLLALIQEDTGLPIFEHAHSQYLMTHPELLAEVLRSTGRSVPESLERRVKEFFQRRQAEAAQGRPPVDRWNAPEPEGYAMKP